MLLKHAHIIKLFKHENIMKPHIKYNGKMRINSRWQCRNEGNTIFLGYGSTPQQAYDDYMTRYAMLNGEEVTPATIDEHVRVHVNARIVMG